MQTRKRDTVVLNGFPRLSTVKRLSTQLSAASIDGVTIGLQVIPVRPEGSPDSRPPRCHFLARGARRGSSQLLRIAPDERGRGGRVGDDPTGSDRGTGLGGVRSLAPEIRFSGLTPIFFFVARRTMASSLNRLAEERYE